MRRAWPRLCAASGQADAGLALVRMATAAELAMAEPGERLPSEYEAWNAATQQWVLRYGFVADRLSDSLRHITRVPASVSGETETFVLDCMREPVAAWRQKLLLLLYRMQRAVYFYDAQVALDIPKLHLLGTAEWEELLPSAVKNGRALDVGTGKGDLALRYKHLFETVVATEVSAALCRRLKHLGFRVFQTPTVELPASEQRFDCVLCLNTLDRCPNPHSLLKNMRAVATIGSPVVIAVPLPFYHLDFFTKSSMAGLSLEGDNTFEGSASAVADELLLPVGLKPVALYRAPYMSSGPYDHPLSQVLDTAIFVCRVMY
ncbi:DREV methyltransferase [Diplonema papillatum]|nr:DREV methyltransferase [Diplonema papillatum]|eukprot:gene7268-11204_t